MSIWIDLRLVHLKTTIPGPDFVEKAIKAGVGSKVKGYVGAVIDDRYAPPIKLSGIIKSIEHGDEHAETEVVVRIGSVYVIVTKKRKPYHREFDFTRLGLNPRETDILVVTILSQPKLLIRVSKKVPSP